MRRKVLPLLGALLLGALFYAGVYALLAGRLWTGDVYPPYSSLRSDPLGTRVLFEALRLVPGVAVRRGYEPLAGGAEAADTVALVAGASAPAWQLAAPDDLREVEAFLAAGGRVVLAFAPLVEDPAFERALAEAAPQRRGPKTKRTPAGPRRPDESRIALRDRWGVAFRYDALKEDEDGPVPGTATRTAPDEALPRSLSWHSGVVFDRLAPAWSVLYAREGRPVLVSRRWGRGTLVLASDSYFLSNEAQRDERRPALVATLLGPARTVLFDETHLGVAEAPGVMTLLRRYRLGGLLAALLAVALLFLWRSAASFLPREEELPAEAVSGRAAVSGLANLLRRGVPPARLLPTCVEEWERTAGPGAPAAEARALAAAAPAKEREILDAYRRIAALRERLATTKGAA